MYKFDDLMQQIEQMNSLYELYEVPDSMIRARARLFHAILSNEVNKLINITMNDMDDHKELRVAMADLLIDVMIYCLSEAVRYKFPVEKLFMVVMASNFTKLGLDGKPIKNGADKFLKGSNFIPPEEAIRAVLYPEEGRTDVIEKLFKASYELRSQGKIRQPNDTMG